MNADMDEQRPSSGDGGCGGCIRRSPPSRTLRTTTIHIVVLLGWSSAVLAEDDTVGNFGALLNESTPATIAVPNLVTAPESAPTFRILPEDVVQESVRQFQFSTNRYAVIWIYSEVGAQKWLAFREAHEGEKVRTVVGHFETPPGLNLFRPMPPAFTNYAQWKEGWLKRRTQKFVGVSEDEAKAITAGLRRK